MNFIGDILSEKKSEKIPLAELKKTLQIIRDQADAALRLLDAGGILPSTSPLVSKEIEAGERVIEGSFTGEKMQGDDGKEYVVPPNYASKSKLVVGDRMKLTMTKSGSFIFKQIAPVERTRVVGALAGDAATGWVAVADGKPYHVLTASVTFYKGKDGDEAVLLVPRNAQSAWAAVENIIAK